MKFRIVLSEHGKDVYKGANIPVMNQMLFTFDAKNKKYAEGFFDKVLIERMGSANEYLFRIVEVK